MGNLLVGIFFIIGGLSGKFVLIGTNSGGLLAVLGFGLVIKGIYDMTRDKQEEEAASSSTALARFKDDTQFEELTSQVPFDETQAQTLELEAESLEEAHQMLNAQLPGGMQIFSKRIVADGKPRTLEAVGDTAEAAFAEARSKIPGEAEILDQKVLTAAEDKVTRVTVEAEDENSARLQMQIRRPQNAVKNVRLLSPAKKGALGFGAKAGQYEVELAQPAVVALTYKTKAKISVKYGKPAADSN